MTIFLKTIISNVERKEKKKQNNWMSEKTKNLFEHQSSIFWIEPKEENKKNIIIVRMNFHESSEANLSHLQNWIKNALRF